MNAFWDMNVLGIQKYMYFVLRFYLLQILDLYLFATVLQIFEGVLFSSYCPVFFVSTVGGGGRAQAF